MTNEQFVQQVYNSVVALLSSKLLDKQGVISMCNCLATIYTTDHTTHTTLWSSLFGILSFDYDQQTKCSYFR